MPELTSPNKMPMAGRMAEGEIGLEQRTMQVR
jgi:hypothetical protein